MKIIWTRQATRQVKMVCDYLDQFSEPAAGQFISRLEKVLDTIEKMPTMGLQSSKNKAIRSLKIKPNWRLYYFWDEPVNTTLIVFLFDQRQDPSKNKY